MTLSTRWLAAVATTVLAAVLGGCAIQPDSAPRDIPEDLQEREESVATAAGGAAEGSDRIYLLAPGGTPQTLRTVQRDTDGDANTLLSELISGPNADEVQAGFRSATPQTLTLNSVRVDDGVVRVDVSDDLLELPAGDLTQAVAQIVFTASEIPTAESVLIRVDGEAREWPDGSGALRSGPLTVYDFIGWAESAQPAFPVSPTPTTASTTTTAPPAPAAPTTAPAPTTTAVAATTTTAPTPTTTAAPAQ